MPYKPLWAGLLASPVERYEPPHEYGPGAPPEEIRRSRFTPTQEAMMKMKVLGLPLMSEEGRIGGLYGKGDLAFDVATSKMPLGLVAGLLRKSRTSIKGAAKVADEFDVFPKSRMPEVARSTPEQRRALQEYVDYKKTSREQRLLVEEMRQEQLDDYVIVSWNKVAKNVEDVFGIKLKQLPAGKKRPIKTLGGKVDPRRGEWETPQKVIDKLQEKWGRWELDAAASPTNTTAKKFYTKEINALTQDWSKDAKKVFVNPPFEQAEPFARKAMNQQAKGVETIMLVPAYFDMNLNPIRSKAYTPTRWWRDVVRAYERGDVEYIDLGYADFKPPPGIEPGKQKNRIYALRFKAKKT